MAEQNVTACFLAELRFGGNGGSAASGKGQGNHIARQHLFFDSDESIIQTAATAQP
ncbi:MAG: hypothetical protein PUK16_02895 [Prevotellaceae bacterium]|nr:hypothetical protein [Prevotella sp.]MDD7529887.1 hypothetical protein [Prevotellaceae bacterium]MDY2634409.1 hypothetical protein [Prevotella sp.]